MYPFKNNIDTRKRKEIRIRDRIRKKKLKSQNENNIIKYKKQRNKVNNMKKIAEEKFENNLDNCLLKNAIAASWSLICLGILSTSE
jgi:hypothetical protein